MLSFIYSRVGLDVFVKVIWGPRGSRYGCFCLFRCQVSLRLDLLSVSSAVTCSYAGPGCHVFDTALDFATVDWYTWPTWTG
jgi:hypothetical protein